MKYMVSLPAEYGQDEEWATGEQPVVPWYPATLEDVFLTVGTFKKSPYAVIKNVDVDIDELAEILTSEYPGLPAQMHENYVYAMVKVAHEHPVGTRFRIRIGLEETRLQNLDTEEFIDLWTEQPIHKPL